MIRLARPIRKLLLAHVKGKVLIKKSMKVSTTKNRKSVVMLKDNDEITEAMAELHKLFAAGLISLTSP